MTGFHKLAVAVEERQAMESEPPDLPALLRTLVRQSGAVASDDPRIEMVTVLVPAALWARVVACARG